MKKILTLITIISFFILSINSYLLNIFSYFELFIIAFFSAYILIETIYMKDIKIVRYSLIYIFILFFILFNRKINDNYLYSKPIYFYYYLKNIFSNLSAFIMIIGNIAIFIPLGIILNKLDSKYKIMYFFFIILVFIPLVEIMQYIFKVGIFDYYDIMLNTLGVIIGWIINKKTTE